MSISRGILPSRLPWNDVCAVETILEYGVQIQRVYGAVERGIVAGAPHALSDVRAGVELMSGAVEIRRPGLAAVVAEVVADTSPIAENNNATLLACLLQYTALQFGHPFIAAVRKTERASRNDQTHARLRLLRFQ